jgi:hypothetical protein
MMKGISGIPWYTEEDYPKLLSLFEDGKDLPEAFHDWEEQAEGTEQSYRQRGFQVFRVPLEPAKFSAWCKREGLRLNAASRKRFAAVTAGKMARADEQK